MEVSKPQIIFFSIFSLIVVFGSYQWGKAQTEQINPSSLKIIDNKTPTQVITTQSISQVKPISTPILKKESTLDKRKWINLLKELNNTNDTPENKSETIDQLINTVKDKEINFYLNQNFPSETLNEITDKRLFTKRLIEEYSGSQHEEENISINGDINFSTGATSSEENTNNFSIKKNQSIFAHLITKSSVAEGKHVFVRWIRQSDSKILLFERKRINLNSNSNWVSITPNEGWDLGSYTVTFYTFESGMHIIAKNIYFIDSILK